MSSIDRDVLLFIQVSAEGDSGPNATWIVGAQWAAAAERAVGEAWVVTPQGTFSPGQTLELASIPTAGSRPNRPWRRLIPELPVTAVKDVLQLVHARRFRRSVDISRWASH